jgi:hypothetical protein
MTTPSRSDHLTMYGMVGVAMHLIVGILVVASFAVIPAGWQVALTLAWVASAIAGKALWGRTVWIPLLASIVLSAVWMTVFFTSR